MNFFAVVKFLSIGIVGLGSSKNRLIEPGSEFPLFPSSVTTVAANPLRIFVLSVFRVQKGVDRMAKCSLFGLFGQNVNLT